ncbi:hypothetical protein [Adhaeribacter radiodurans]|nr:hypothetical protein [Adhaeribacter radiodurans]
MNKLKGVFLLMLIALTIAACNSKNTSNQSSTESDEDVTKN